MQFNNAIEFEYCQNHEDSMLYIAKRWNSQDTLINNDRLNNAIVVGTVPIITTNTTLTR